MAARPNIELCIIPDHCGWHPGLEGAFALIESRRANANKASIIFVGTRRSVLMLHQDNDVDAYKRAIDWITRISLQHDDSLKLIADLHKRMERAK